MGQGKRQKEGGKANTRVHYQAGDCYEELVSILLGPSEVVHRTLLRLVHLKNGRGENVFPGFYLHCKGCIYCISVLIGYSYDESQYSFSPISHLVTSEKPGRKQIVRCSGRRMLSGYLSKEPVDSAVPGDGEE